ncbi:MAG: hypothetical protein FD153_308 [Rhodospirillaceae bacterium]|nr:MAG: hypothetical protein FD153_308 [Rhodospirillaceae bacterium]
MAVRFLKCIWELRNRVAVQAVVCGEGEGSVHTR